MLEYSLNSKVYSRYDRITREKDFAEYYLLVTLISTAVAMAVLFVSLKRSLFVL